MSLQNRCQRLENKRTKMYNNNWICISHNVKILHVYYYMGVYAFGKVKSIQCNHTITPFNLHHNAYTYTHSHKHQLKKKGKKENEKIIKPQSHVQAKTCATGQTECIEFK